VTEEWNAETQEYAIVDYRREYVAEALFRVDDVSRFVYLFSDMMLICKIPPRGSTDHLYEVLKKVSLERTIIVSINEDHNSFEIGEIGQGIYKFQTDRQHLRKKWTRLIRTELKKYGGETVEKRQAIDAFRSQTVSKRVKVKLGSLRKKSHGPTLQFSSVNPSSSSSSSSSSHASSIAPLMPVISPSSPAILRSKKKTATTTPSSNLPPSDKPPEPPKTAAERSAEAEISELKRLLEEQRAISRALDDENNTLRLHLQVLSDYILSSDPSLQAELLSSPPHSSPLP